MYKPVFQSSQITCKTEIIRTLGVLVVHTDCDKHILMFLTGKIAILFIFSAKSYLFTPLEITMTREKSQNIYLYVGLCTAN